MDISQRGIDLIVGFEGKYKLQPDGRYKSYLDTLAKLPVWTVYCGLTKGVTKDTCVTVEEGDRMFAKELAVSEDVVEASVTVPLNQNQFDALVSFVYNCGPRAFRNSTLLKFLNQGKYDSVPAQLMRWTHAGGKEYAGLVQRRKAEGALFLEPLQPVVIHTEDPSVQPPMPQRVEEAKGKVTEVVKNSHTIRWAAGGLIAYLAQQATNAYDWLFGVVKDAGPQITDFKTQLSPFAALVKMTPTVLVIVTIVCIIGAIARRVADHVEGKPR